MREILFRCWDKENSEFAYSNDDLDEVNFQFEGNDLVCYLLGWETDYLGEIQPKWVKLNEKVEQYTGLTDKNGTKIFEGDIVSIFGDKYEVIQHIGAFGLAPIECVGEIDCSKFDEKLLKYWGKYQRYEFAPESQFVSLWEIYRNFEMEDNQISFIEVVGNIHESEGNNDINR